MTFYAIMKDDGTFELSYQGGPWITAFKSNATSISEVSRGKVVKVDIIIRTPKRRAVKSALKRESKTMAKTKAKEAPKKVAPKKGKKGMC